MVFAVGGVCFDCEFEVGGIVGDDCICDCFVAEFFQFKNVGFPADAPRPETVAVTVRNKRVSVEFAKAPIHGWVRRQASFQCVDVFGHVLIAVFYGVEATEGAKDAEPPESKRAQEKPCCRHRPPLPAQPTGMLKHLG